jgi:hypothetical protein
MSVKFNPLPRPFDLSGAGSTFTGGTLTSDLDMQDNAIIMQAPGGTRYRVTIGDDGVLTTAAILEGSIGSPWLFLFGTI